MKSFRHLILLVCLGISLTGIFQSADHPRAQSVIGPEATATYTPTPSLTPLPSSTPTATATWTTTKTATSTASSTPAATNTPTSTGTITAAPTDTPSPTLDLSASPSPSPTFAPVELLTNGGFENPGASSKLAADWTLKHSGFAKRRCNTTDPLKVYAHSGQCAYQFKGGSGANTSVVQKSLPLLNVNDLLTLSAWIQAKKLTEGGRVQLRVKYLDSTRTKLNLPVTIGVYSYTLLADTLTVEQEVTNVRVQIRIRSSAGKFLIDDVSLMQSR